LIFPLCFSFIKGVILCESTALLLCEDCATFITILVFNVLTIILIKTTLKKCPLAIQLCPLKGHEPLNKDMDLEKNGDYSITSTFSPKVGSELMGAV
jgi:hypothetical protein